MGRPYTNGVASLAFTVLGPDEKSYSLTASQLGRFALSSMAGMWPSPHRDAEFQERCVGAGLEDPHVEDDEGHVDFDPFGHNAGDRKSDFAMALDNDESETIRVDFPINDGDLRALRTCAMFADMMGASVERPLPHYEISPDSDDDPDPEFKGVSFLVNGTNHVQLVTETADPDEIEYVSRVFSMDDLEARMTSQVDHSILYSARSDSPSIL